jgi:hypothetical protein
MVWQSGEAFNDLERERQMSYKDLHPYLRGSHLEGRTPLRVEVEDKSTAVAQCILLGNYVTEARLPYAVEVDYGMSCRDGQWYVHYWRGWWDAWDAPDPTTRKVGPPYSGLGMRPID